ncbi:MAG TPA: dihydrolipoamide acetyltransferase family protein [Candidatus Dormibacteraeota bacterium]|nr:dihydrolipoamide acetyltransferase family protein [Candidatus Dormibacteraeota bacterium]
MAVSQIKMPQLGESVTEGTVEKWLKREGEFVKRDEPIVEVVTDKVNAEIPSPFEGTLVKIDAGEGQVVRVGAVIAQIETAGGAAATAPAPAKAAVAAAEAPASAPTLQRSAAAAPAAKPSDEHAKLSPAVRKLAAERGIDPTAIQGSGLGGRVTREDVLAASSAPAAAPSARPAAAPAQAAPSAPVKLDGAREELVKLSVMRRSIADHMVRSLATSPHAWTLQEVDVTNLVRYREAEKDGFRARHGTALTYMPFVAQLLGRALKQFPWLNSTWTEDGVVLKRYLNLGIAVSIPDGLIVPVLKDADQLGFSELVRRMNDLIERARTKQLKPEDVQGGTFTLNNTGATGSVASQPIINQPQAAILTTEAIVKRPVVIGEGIAVRDMMNMCLSFDHRIIDGMMAGQFLSHMKQGLEEWSPASIRL